MCESHYNLVCVYVRRVILCMLINLCGLVCVCVAFANLFLNMWVCDLTAEDNYKRMGCRKKNELRV